MLTKDLPTAGGYELFIWLVNISSSAFFINWLIISYTSYRFHACLRAQADPLFSAPYAWRSIAWPLMPVWLFTISTLLLVCCIAAGAMPLNGAEFSVYAFFSYTIGVVLIVTASLGYKLIMRTKFRDVKTADLITGRRILTNEEIIFLDQYYELPKWRRFTTYVQLW
jgi:yeast amino acid transporter